MVYAKYQIIWTSFPTLPRWDTKDEPTYIRNNVSIFFTKITTIHWNKKSKL